MSTKIFRDFNGHIYNIAYSEIRTNADFNVAKAVIIHLASDSGEQLRKFRINYSPDVMRRFPMSDEQLLEDAFECIRWFWEGDDDSWSYIERSQYYVLG